MNNNVENLSITIKRLKQDIAKLKKAKEDAEKEKLKYLAKMNKFVTGQEQTGGKSAEEYTQEMINYLNNIIAIMPGHIYWKNKNGVYLGCNDQQAKTLNFNSGKDIIGKTDHDLPWKNGAANLIAIDKDVMRTKKIHIVEEPVTLPDKSKAIFLSQKVPLLEKNGDAIGILGVSVNITEQKQLEKKLKAAKVKAEAANIAKTEFIANISHDIRTPISGIIGMTQVLELRLGNTKIKTFVQKIAKSANQLLRILDEIIDFSKIETRYHSVRCNNFNLRKLITEIIEMFNTTIKEKNIKLSVNYQDNIPSMFIGDDIRINRILLNLISNAIKFTKQGYILINVTIQKEINNKVIIKLIIEDTGIGISKDKIPFIFERFSRLSSSYKGTYKGIGLGLAIVKRFLTEIGGAISVANRINEGSVFSCTIPLRLPNKKQLEKHSEQISEKKHFKKNRHSKLNILLVEDDKTCQLSQQILLTDMGHNVDTADSGEEAIRLITKPYDLILSDIGLPDLDGYELAKKIKLSKNNKNTPIIGLTAHMSEKYKKQCFDSGINKVLQKPMDIKEIQQVIYQIWQDKLKEDS